MMVRRKSEDGELFQWIIIRRPTLMEMVSATAIRRDVFAMMLTGFAAAATSDIAAEDTSMWLPERPSSDRMWSESRCRMNGHRHKHDGPIVSVPMGPMDFGCGGMMDESSMTPKPRFFSRLHRRDVNATVAARAR